MMLAHSPPIVKFTPSVFGFPDRIYTKLRYCDSGSQSCTSGATGLQIFRWNSVFDPDFTNAGHQPLYRDTYAAIYDQYAVVKAHAIITLINTNATVGMLCGCVTDDDTTITTTNVVLQEQNHGINFMLTPLSGSASEVTFTATWDCSEVLNIDPYSSLTYKTAVGSNPTEVSALALWGAAADASSTVSLIWRVQLIQEVLWTELSTPSVS
jgi:hypothetical protein